jgi:pSer/pThr/pTyr-binding forkhead associated (FHA) protein
MAPAMPTAPAATASRSEQAVAVLPEFAPGSDSAPEFDDHAEPDPYPPYSLRFVDVDDNLSGMVDHLSADLEAATVEVDPEFYSYLEQLAVSSTIDPVNFGDVGASATADASLGFEFMPAFDLPEAAETARPEAIATFDLRDLSHMAHAAELSESPVEFAPTSSQVIAPHFPGNTIAELNYILQFLDADGQWQDWGSIGTGGLEVGRDEGDDSVGANTLAIQHMRFAFDLGMLTVEDLGSLNGVYLRVNEPVPLVDGIRFRIGEHVLEFREAEPNADAPPARSNGGEVFCSRELSPLAFVDLIRPNGQSGLRFPVTRSDATVIGPEGPAPHIALTGDHTVSAAHAQIRCEDGLFYLEDLKSRLGTFVQVRGVSAVSVGDVILAGRAVFRIIEPASE